MTTSNAVETKFPNLKKREIKFILMIFAALMPNTVDRESLDVVPSFVSALPSWAGPCPSLAASLGAFASGASCPVAFPPFGPSFDSSLGSSSLPRESPHATAAGQQQVDRS